MLNYLGLKPVDQSRRQHNPLTQEVVIIPIVQSTSRKSRVTSSSSSSSSEDEAVEAKRLKLDPDYVPSTASEGTQTGTNSQVQSEEEDESTETDENDSWHPSVSTESEEISSMEDDDL
jgi:hypothetical protein